MPFDPQSIIRILTNDQAQGIGPQTPEQIKSRQDYGYNLLGNTKMQGNAVYGPWNALFDTLKGGIGGRYLNQGDEAIKAGLVKGGQDASIAAFPDQAPTVGSPSPINSASLASKGKLDELIQSVAKTHGIDPAQLKAYVDIESGGNSQNTTGSYKGLLQLSDSEFKKYADKGWNIYNSEHNLIAGARKLKDESAAFEQKYGRAPSATDLYLMHQQGTGGYDKHLQNPENPAWMNMYNTAEGQQKGQAWAKKAIWGNVPDNMKAKFGSVDNIKSKDFINMWDQRVSRGMGGQQQQAGAPQQSPGNQQPGEEQQFPAITALLDKMFPQGAPQQPPPGPQSPPTAAPQAPPPGMMPLGGPKTGDNALGKTPEQVAQQVTNAGKGGILGDVSATNPPGAQPPPAPAMQPPQAQPGQVQQPQKPYDLPTNPQKAMTREQLQAVLQNPYIDPATKQKLLDKAMTQGEMQSMDVDGGKLFFNPLTKEQKFVPIGKEGVFNFKGMALPTYTIKDKGMDKPPSTYFQLPGGKMVDGTGKEVDKNDIMKAGGPSDAIIPPIVKQLQEEGLGFDTREQEVKGRNEAIGKQRSEHIALGEGAFKAGQMAKILSELENAPSSVDMHTGPWAPKILELQKIWNDIAPGSWQISKGPLTIAELFSGMANVAGGEAARKTDPNPTLLQFQKLIEAKPGILQTPNGRRVLIELLKNDVARDKEISQIAVRAKTNDEYLDKLQQVKDKYDDPKKTLIPKEYLEDTPGNTKVIPGGEIKEISHPDEAKGSPSGTRYRVKDGPNKGKIYTVP